MEHMEHEERVAKPSSGVRQLAAATLLRKRPGAKRQARTPKEEECGKS
jgi:hypothetical protein